MAQYFTVYCKQDIDEHLGAIHSSAELSYNWIKQHSGSPMELLRAIKFDAVGFHPLAGHALNLIEQVNQTATYIVALEGARLLFDLHPGEPGYVIAPGAYMSHPLDIMSINEGQVGAETFAAVDPRNNNKLKKDLVKLSTRTEGSRYVFFSSPRYPETKRRIELETNGIHVWSIATSLSVR
ncbi:hypothetical protein ROSMUCSMR3_02815 [Roseovarius mucosus]|uniref:Uncharacterized protein n=1 Tax=Roseovarius mucosus TaxID=215743 RepID=A0A1V0RRP3_9RHOB|nr:hypothetical protein [Roseovarius mucosus]ARE84282.1 hypothetical protein ROSMUCSMR3_02815 [Roseovarius mucosus]